MAEGARLESVYAGDRIEGSNPSPSATLMSVPLFYKKWLNGESFGTGSQLRNRCI